MEENTQELMNALQKENDIYQFTRENADKFLEKLLVSYLDDLLKKTNSKKADIIKKAGLSTVYGYQIFDGKREPKRDKVIQIAIGFGLSVEETQRLLKISGHSELYPKVKRDALFIYGIHNRLNIDEIEELLFDMGEKGLET